MPDSTSKPRKRKTARKHFVPPKPYKKFPLTPHAGGKWMKKIRGKLHYFGTWAKRVNGELVRVENDGWKDARALYNAQAEALQAGRTPRSQTDDELTVKQLCNQFLTAKSRKMESGELSGDTFREYRQIAEMLSVAFGKTRLVDELAADDFEKLRADTAKVWGPYRLGKFVQCVRTIFKYGFDAGLIEKPVRFGPEFKRPSADVFRKHKNASAKRLFTAVEIRQLLDGKTVEGKGGKSAQLAGASPQLRAMVLLGINCGFGNTDVADVSLSAVDLKRGWIDFPRPKTGIERRCPLWPETIVAIKTAIAERPKSKAKADSDCVFITAHGNRWVREKITNLDDVVADDYSTAKVTGINSVGLEFGKVLKRLGINGRSGLGFYSLRHTFRTVADATKDFPAANLIMGHTDPSMAAVYREHIDDDRLLAVVNHVRTWLFG